MAKNYTFAEVVKIINEGTDLMALVDIGRRYPVLLQKVTKVCTKAGDDFVALMDFMPEYLTANKVNTAIKALIIGSEDDNTGSNDSGDSEESKENAGNGNDSKDYDSMSVKQLWEILKNAGKHKTVKSTKKADLLEAIKAMEAGDDNDDEDSNEENGNQYDGKTAMELFKECKKRGIKAAPKKTAKFYAELLTKDDAKSEDTGKDDEDGDDWDNDDAGEEEEKKEIKKEKAAGKTAKAAKSKKAQKEEKDDDGDDDDDWDI